MENLNVFLLAFALIFLGQVGAHTLMTNVTINGQTREDCLRLTMDDGWSYFNNSGIYSSFPIMDVPAPYTNGILSRNYTCGFMPFASFPARTKCPIAAGSTLGFSYWHGGTGTPTEDPILDRFIARSHKGPIIAHLAKSDTGLGNVWFKIYQEGITYYDPSNWANTRWASPDSLLANNGMVTVTIPADIAPGNYLLRTEIIALHNAQTQSGAQPYVRCVELTITGSGTVNPPGMAIPGPEYATLDHPGMRYNLYTNTQPTGANFPFPGGDVYVAGSIPSTSTSTTAAPSGTSTTSRPATTTPSGTTTSNAPGNSTAPACARDSDCASGVCKIDGTCFVMCESDADCESGVCKVDRTCFVMSPASRLVAFGFLAFSLFFVL